jgi:hypothetical protein
MRDCFALLRHLSPGSAYASRTTGEQQEYDRGTCYYWKQFRARWVEVQYQTNSQKVTRTQFERIALLLQGGGALGSYQAGVYQALAEADLIRI